MILAPNAKELPEVTQKDTSNVGPLTGIQSILKLLETQAAGELNETQSTMVRSALGNCDRLLEHINALIDSSVADSEPRIFPDKVEPAVLVNDAANLMALLFKGPALIVRTEVQKNLPFVNADRKSINHVFENLLSNAAKYSPDSGKITIAANKGDRAGMVRFSVSDEGSGIPGEILEDVFLPFFRAPSQNDEAKGLGLSICREIVEAHGGKIDVTSIPGEKTEFYFYLPVL
ncbi:MAG: HAMP domain-containing sensor histidine kinase [Verrucomicrobiales bacterium]|nr:HAMP domain-containing sensor histidine kinase [Verrucomicrobiales bacterium]